MDIYVGAETAVITVNLGCQAHLSMCRCLHLNCMVQHASELLL